jgi:acetyl esterase/lipase
VTEDRSVLSRKARHPDRSWAYGHLADNAVDLWLPIAGTDVEHQHPLVVMIHGGFWRPEYDRSHVAPLCDAFAQLGYAAAAIEYSRTPGSPDATVNDVAAALRWVDVCDEFAALRTAGGVVVGHSAGGHLALLSASTVDVTWRRATIALAPVADLVGAEAARLDNDAVRAFLGTVAEQRPDLDPIRVSDADQPVHLIHGTSDEIVPISLSESYVEAHPSASLHSLDDVGHFALIDPRSDAWRSVAAVVASALSA